MTQQKQAQSLLASLGRDPAVIPHQFDIIGDRVLLANIPLAAQSQAAFLDQRVLTPQTQGAWIAWLQFAAAAKSTPPGRLAYILHAGHCGSTLVSKLLAEITGVRALREPLPLRPLAEDLADGLAGAGLLDQSELDQRLDSFERVWACAGGAVVKATSMCCGLADRLRRDAPVAFIYVKPQIYLALLLGGANTQFDLRNFAKMRIRRLLAKTEAVGQLSALSPGELAAMSWLAETTAITAAKRPVFEIDFDDFLRRPAERLAVLCDHFGWPAAPGAIERALSGPLMRQYAKAPEHPYDASSRAAIIAEDSVRWRAEIDRGMGWLAQIANESPDAGAALARFAAG